MAKDFLENLQKDFYKQVETKSKNTGTKLNEIIIE